MYKYFCSFMICHTIHLYSVNYIVSQNIHKNIFNPVTNWMIQ